MNFNFIEESDRYTNSVATFSNLLSKYFPLQNQSYEMLEQANTSKSLLELLECNLGIFSIVDFHTKAYLYISPNVSRVLGRTPITFIKGGLIRSIDLFTDSQRNILIMHMFPEMFRSFHSYSLENRAKDLRVSYTTLLTTPSGQTKWFLHQFTVLETDANGFPTIGIKHFIDIHHIKTDKHMNYSLDIKNAKGEFINVYNKIYVDSPLNDILSPRETELVQYLEMGFSAKQIADKMAISTNTVNNHRKKIFKKYNVNSALELLHMMHAK